jgi:hypothetical protein
LAASTFCASVAGANAASNPSAMAHKSDLFKFLLTTFAFLLKLLLAEPFELVFETVKNIS